jgi:hypothetical protein
MPQLCMLRMLENILALPVWTILNNAITTKYKNLESMLLGKLQK